MSPIVLFKEIYAFRRVLSIKTQGQLKFANVQLHNRKTHSRTRKLFKMENLNLKTNSLLRVSAVNHPLITRAYERGVQRGHRPWARVQEGSPGWGWGPKRLRISRVSPLLTFFLEITFFRGETCAKVRKIGHRKCERPFCWRSLFGGEKSLEIYHALPTQ